MIPECVRGPVNSSHVVKHRMISVDNVLVFLRLLFLALLLLSVT